MEIVAKEYQRDPKLKKDDVKKLQDWLDGQPHLPKMTEQEVIWFLKSCYFSNEAAKLTIDNHFTVKTMCPEIFRNRDPKALQKHMNVISYSILPEKTPDNCTVLITHVIDPNPDHFTLNDHIRLFDMVAMLDLYKNGSQEGFRCCYDMKDVGFGHVAKFSLISMKKFLFYLQEGMPVRLKGLHFFNVHSVMDKLLMIMKPFLKREVLAMLHLHDTVQDMAEFIPTDILPAEHGGKYKSFAELNEEMRNNLLENSEFFAYQDSQLVDENKRPGQPKNVADVFGVEGTFKKLDID